VGKTHHPEHFAIRIRWERFSLSAFCEVGGAKWGEGRGEVFRFSIFHTGSLARFNVQKHKAHKILNPLELGTLKRRERRAPVEFNPCHPITQSSIVRGSCIRPDSEADMLRRRIFGPIVLGMPTMRFHGRQ
jgi:hypothetical protein